MKTEKTTQWYVTCYQNHWGRGDTPQASKKEARKAGGRGNTWVTYKLPAWAQTPWVDGLGRVRWNFPEDWSEEQIDQAFADQTPMEIVAQGRGVRRG